MYIKEQQHQFIRYLNTNVNAVFMKAVTHKSTARSANIQMRFANWIFTPTMDLQQQHKTS